MVEVACSWIYTEKKAKFLYLQNSSKQFSSLFFTFYKNNYQKFYYSISLALYVFNLHFLVIFFFSSKSSEVKKRVYHFLIS